jgi:hypothetical protein
LLLLSALILPQVQALMKDEKFQSEMRSILDSPQYKAAMARAKVNFEVINRKMTTTVLNCLFRRS